jgi:hypothetical protein
MSFRTRFPSAALKYNRARSPPDVPCKLSTGALAAIRWPYLTTTSSTSPA